MRLPSPRSTLFPYTTLFRSSGYGKVKRDYAGNTTYNAAAANLPGNPFTSATSTTYVSPITNPCQKNVVLTYVVRSEEHTSELQSRFDLVCRLLLEKKKKHTL